MIYNLEEKINNLFQTSSDINEHFPAIIKYGQECDHITEMGVRAVCSTWGWLACAPKEGLVSYDLITPEDYNGDLQSVKDTAILYGIPFKFIQGDTLKVDIEKTDLLFIDTWHRYEQLKAELQRHSGNVRKYICLHDTTTFAHIGEGLTSIHSWEGNMSLDKGLWDAVLEFLENEHNTWKLEERFTNNNGFTVLKRIK